LGSLLLPGLGQYVQGQPLEGAAFTGAALSGYSLYNAGDRALADATDLPRTAAGQRSLLGIQLAGGAGMLSAYESFRHALPRFQEEGKYGFVERLQPSSALFAAPFDFRLLSRWTTWVALAETGAVVALVTLTETSPGRQYQTFVTRDAFFAGGMAYGAGVGEEALFRGWLYPMLYQNVGRRFWLANSLQAAMFGGLHVGQAGPFALEITASAFYEGWLTRRNGWDIRESVFHHFWYDAAVFTTYLLTQDRLSATLVFPTVRF
jgi:membrane protease YdiL (CAAX protease family)